MRYTLSQFIQRVLNARLIGWSVMKRVIDIAYGVIQQGEDGRVSQFLTVGTQRRNIAGEGMVQTEQAESRFPNFCRGARLRGHVRDHRSQFSITVMRIATRDTISQTVIATLMILLKDGIKVSTVRIHRPVYHTR